MDTRPQMQRPWLDPDSSRLGSPEQKSAELRQIPGIATALDEHVSLAGEHQLPPIATTFDRHVPNAPNSTFGIELGGIRSSRPTSSSSEARPEKRPRRHWSQESTPALSARTDTSSHKHEDDRTRNSYATWIRSGHPHLTQQEGACPNCADTDELVARMVSGLLRLEHDIRQASPVSTAATVNTSTEITKLGLRYSLLWVCDGLEMLGREVAANSRPLVDIVTAAEPGSRPSNFKVTSEPMEQHLKRRASCLADQVPYGASSTIQKQLPVPLDSTYPPSTSHITDTMKRIYHVEPPPARPAQSPRGSPPASTFGSTQSPVHSQPSSRTLPSPTSLPYSSSASSVFSSYGEVPLTLAQASHLQDLQHQISTKTLALQTLQREHDQLLAAFSRSQIRCTTLDKKSQVSDHEINTLSEDKVRLQQQVESLEAQVEELVHARDEAQQQSAADGAQWQRIMTMSSQLQIRGAEETRQYRVDKEAWEHDRDGLQRRIQDLEVGKLSVGSSHGLTTVTSISSDDVLASASLDTLREEIVRLQRSCAEMEKVLRDIQGETESMGPSLATLTNVNERISALSKTRREKVTVEESEKRRRSGEGG